MNTLGLPAVRSGAWASTEATSRSDIGGGLALSGSGGAGTTAVRRTVPPGPPPLTMSPSATRPFWIFVYVDSSHARSSNNARLPIELPFSGTRDRSILVYRSCVAPLNSLLETGSGVVSARRTVPPGPPPFRRTSFSTPRSRIAANVSSSQPSACMRARLPIDDPSSGTCERRALRRCRSEGLALDDSSSSDSSARRMVPPGPGPRMIRFFSTSRSRTLSYLSASHLSNSLSAELVTLEPSSGTRSRKISSCVRRWRVSVPASSGCSESLVSSANVRLTAPPRPGALTTIPFSISRSRTRQYFSSSQPSWPQRFPFPILAPSSGTNESNRSSSLSLGMRLLAEDDILAATSSPRRRRQRCAFTKIRCSLWQQRRAA